MSIFLKRTLLLACVCLSFVGSVRASSRVNDPSQHPDRGNNPSQHPDRGNNPSQHPDRGNNPGQMPVQHP
jgi:hypothetical protein